jgi:hypothetical protein
MLHRIAPLLLFPSFSLEGLQRLLHAWAVENLLSYKLIDPTMLNNSCDLSLKTRVMNSDQQPWGDSDLVHLTPDGYRDLAIIITDGI